MDWVELFAVLIACHLGGDFVLQTDWQAKNKHGGLGRDPVKRRALLSHIGAYTLAFAPALVWVGVERSLGWALAAAALVAIPHLIQDDGRLVGLWARRVKGIEEPGGSLLVALDQSFHVIALLLAALVVA